MHNAARTTGKNQPAKSGCFSPLERLLLKCVKNKTASADWVLANFIFPCLSQIKVSQNQSLFIRNIAWKGNTGHDDRV